MINQYWPLREDEVYISIDIEADGPAPGINSMLSLGAARFNHLGELLDTFSENLKPLPDAQENESTMAWWKTQPVAWKAATENQVEPQVAISRFYAWITLPRYANMRRVCVAYPAGFDYTWVLWYLHKFGGKDPFRHSCLDIKTLAMTCLGNGFTRCSKRFFPKTWKPKKKHNHIAVDDAVEQGELLFQIVNELRELNYE